ncbi:MAG: hypothetical protein AAF587_28855 [Bacteroidota bacterium]
MKQVVHALFLAWFAIPHIQFAATYPDHSLQVLQFCQDQMVVIDSFSSELSGLESLIEQYDRQMSKQQVSAIATLEKIGTYSLPARSTIDQWQHSVSPYVNDLAAQTSIMNAAYEWGKLLSIQEQLSPLSQQQHQFWRHIDRIDLLTNGLLHQIQIVKIRQESFHRILQNLAETSYDSWMRQQPWGEMWVEMKTDMKQLYRVLERIRILEPENLLQIRSDFQFFRTTLSQHLHSVEELRLLPPQQQQHYLAFYQIVCFEVIPRIHQILEAYEANHYVFFRFQFEAQLGELSDYYALTQTHVREMATTDQEPIISSAP